MASYTAVADEVRAELARQRLSGVRAAKALGWTQNYIQRHLSGTVPFDVADLQALADLLEVPVTNFFQVMSPADGYPRAKGSITGYIDPRPGALGVAA